MGEPLRVPLEAVTTSEEDVFFGAVYRGKPFTGIAWSDEDGEYSEIAYVDGTAHGRCFSLFANGALSSEEWVEYGQTVRSTDWWPPGDVIWRRHTPEGTQFYDQSGALIIERTPHYERLFYPSGVLRREQLYEQTGARFCYFGKDGTKAAAWRRTSNGLRWQETEFVFDNAYIRAHDLELLEEHDFERCFARWVEQPEMAPEAAGRICRLLESENLRIRYLGARLAGVLRITEAEPLLRKALLVKACPPDVRSLDRACMSYGRTVAEEAARALKALHGR